MRHKARICYARRAGDVVTVRVLVDEKWVRVTAESADLGDAEG